MIGFPGKPQSSYWPMSVDFEILPCDWSVDLSRRSYDTLFGLDNKIFESGLVNALVMLCSNLEMDIKCKPNITKVIAFFSAKLLYL